jgi:hypothetical protein
VKKAEKTKVQKVFFTLFTRFGLSERYPPPVKGEQISVSHTADSLKITTASEQPRFI